MKLLAFKGFISDNKNIFYLDYKKYSPREENFKRFLLYFL